MRIVDLARDYLDETKRRLFRFYLRKRASIFQNEVIRPGHMYRNEITGEYVTVETIASQVLFRRHDADARDEWSLDKDSAQLALDVDLLIHNKRRCNKCPNRGR